MVPVLAPGQGRAGSPSFVRVSATAGLVKNAERDIQLDGCKLTDRKKELYLIFASTEKFVIASSL